MAPKTRTKKDSDVIVKSEVARGKKGEAPTIQDVKMSSVPYPNFSVNQPAIGAFAIKNPENMAAVICFVMASMMQRWQNLKNFPLMMQFLRQSKGGLYPYPGPVEKGGTGGSTPRLGYTGLEGR